MAGFGVKIEASGFESIEKETRMILNAKVGKEISNAVFADMKDALEEHIRDDVYSHAIYKPTKYLRRSDDSNMGVSLRKAVSEEEYTQQIGPYDYATMDWVAGLSYEPTGKHEHEEWSDTNGDALIGRIERKDPPYNWEPIKGPKIPERPFWQLFIEELIEGGRFAHVIERELKERGIMEPEDRVTGVTRQSEDGNY